MKQCTTCGVLKTVEEFHKRKDTVDGLRAKCKECHNAHYRAKFQEDPEIKLERNRRHYRNNKAYYYAKSAKRRAAQLERTVSWANEDDIQLKYNTAKYLTELTGEQYHVDHIIPLQGERVSGLHVENNLRVILAKENLSKGNSLTQDGKELRR